MTAIGDALTHRCAEFFRLTLTVDHAARVYAESRFAWPHGTEQIRDVMVARMKAGDDWVIARMNLCIHSLKCETGCREYLYRENKKTVLIFSRNEAA